MLSFGGTRTYHRMVVNMEDAGFEIRDQIMWIYGSGFPKSMDISKAIDKAAGVEREDTGEVIRGGCRKARSGGELVGSSSVEEFKWKAVTLPATPEAIEWKGWGTALKPAVEPIVVARKPLSEDTIAANVLKHGTGGLNIDECRIELNGDYKCKSNGRPSLTGLGDNYDPSEANIADTVGRFPANVILDETAGQMLDEQTGVLTSGSRSGKRTQPKTKNAFGKFELRDEQPSEGSSGGASRFFYCAKVSKSERSGSTHPTMKPLALMRYLVRLVTPSGGLVLDPFAGSGTTGLAAMQEGFVPVLMESDEEYAAGIEDRLRKEKDANSSSVVERLLVSAD